MIIPVTGAAPIAGQAAQGAPGTPAGPAALLGLRLGEVVQVGFVEDLGRGEGIVDIGGRLFRARWPEGMASGTRAELRVVATGPPLVLKVPVPGEEGLTRLLSPPATGLTHTVRALLEMAEATSGGGTRRLLEGAEILRLPMAPEGLSTALSRLFRRSGVFHEAVLARGEIPDDLKSLALRILGEEAGPRLTKLAESLLGHIEAHQARSALEGKTVMPLVLPWGGEYLQGEWEVEEKRGKTASEEAVSGALRIRLEMPCLGPVEVAFRWGPAGNSVRLRLGPAGLQSVSPRLSELADALSGEGRARLLDLRAEPLVPANPNRGGGLMEVLA